MMTRERFRGGPRAAWAVIVLLFAGSGAVTASTIEIDFDPTAFPAVPNIDNPYLPIDAASTRVYRGIVSDACEFSKETIGYAPGVEMVAGVATRVVRDQAWLLDAEDGECIADSAVLEEDTIDYYAEDDDGNVWYLGEETYTPAEDSPLCSSEGSWLAQVDEAEPGLLMLANPQPGDRYQQEFDEDNAEDWGAVLRLNRRVAIEFGTFDDCAVTREWSPLEPGAIEKKSYCMADGAFPGGLTLVEELKEKTLRVEYIGDALPGDLGAFPGEADPFPAEGALGCTVPAP